MAGRGAAVGTGGNCLEQCIAQLVAGEAHIGLVAGLAGFARCIAWLRNDEVQSRYCKIPVYSWTLVGGSVAVGVAISFWMVWSSISQICSH